MTAHQDTTNPAQAHKRVRRKRRWIKRVGVALGMLILLVGLAAWLVTRSWFIAWRLEPVLSKRLGGDVTIGAVEYQGDGWFRVSNVELRAPGIEGEGGVVARLDDARLLVDPSRLKGLDIQISRASLDGLLIRLSEDATLNERALNIYSLNPDWGQRDPDSRHPPPMVDIRNATLELGTHQGRSYEMVGRRQMQGSLAPTRPGGEWYDFELKEVVADGANGADDVGADSTTTAPAGAPDNDGLIIRGRWNHLTNEQEARINHVVLDDRTYRMCPRYIKRFWDQMELKGRMGETTVSWMPGETPSIQAPIEDVEMTFLIDTADVWARYANGEMEPAIGRPRMQLKSGLIQLTRDHLVLSGLKGTLRSSGAGDDTIAMPYSVQLTMGPLPPLDWANREAWFKKVMEAPFRATFVMEDFRKQPGDGAGSIELPAPVARVFSRLQLTSWVMSTAVEVSRTNPGEKTSINGQAVIREASLSYRKFPYPIENAEGYLQFRNDKVIVHQVQGRAAGGAIVTLHGETEPKNHAAVKMQVSATAVPVDDRLRGALKESELEAYDAMFHQPSLDAMQEAGLVSSAAERAKAQDDVARLESELQSILAAAAASGVERSEQRVALEQQLADARARADRPVVNLGGTIDLDLLIEREAGEDKPTITTGRIGIHDAWVMYRVFPYPVHVTGGTLDWQPDRVVLMPGPDGRGLPAETINGGHGWVSGDIEFKKVEGKRRTSPHLVFDVKGDRVHDSMFAVIPLTADEREAAESGGQAVSWPGRTRAKAARIASNLGINGTIDYAGRIERVEDGPTTYDFDVILAGATGTPADALATELALSGPVWPAGYSISGLDGRMHISREGVTISDVHATSPGGGDVTGSAQIRGEQGGRSTNLQVGVTRHAIGPEAMNLVPPSKRSLVEELWQEFQPAGLVTATIEYSPGADGDVTAEEGRVRVVPETLEVSVNDERVRVQGVDGEFVLSEEGVSTDMLKVALACGERAEGTLEVHGTYSADAGGGLDIAGTWNGGELESPLVRRLLGPAARQEAGHDVGSLNLAGTFDSTFQFEGGGEHPADYRIALRPHSLGMDVHNVRVSLEVEGGELIFTPERMRIADLSGHHAGGAFQVSGSMRTAMPMDVDLRLEYDGRLLSEQVQAFLPDQIRETLIAIKFDERMNSRLADGVLRMSQAAGPDGRTDWRTHFEGRLVTNDAAFTAGVPFTQMNGRLEIVADREPGSAANAEINARANRVTVMGHVLTDVHAPLKLVEDGTLVEIPEMSARAAHGGAVTASARVGVGARRDYQASVEMAGVSLEEFFNVEPEPGQPAPPSAADEAHPNGELYGSIDVAGMREDESSRRGRGLIRMLNGRLAAIPLGLQLLRVMQMSLPLGGSLDTADIEFYIDGERVVFSRILMESTMGASAALTLNGEGEMDYNTLDLNLRFRSRGGLVLIKDVVGSMTDRLWAIEVTGPLGSPAARLIALPGK